MKEIGAAHGVPRQDTINLLRAARIEAALVDGEGNGGNTLGRDTQPLDSIAPRRLRDGKDAVHALQQAQVARISHVVVDATQGESPTDLVERYEIEKCGYRRDARDMDQAVAFHGMIETWPYAPEGRRHRYQAPQPLQAASPPSRTVQRHGGHAGSPHQVRDEGVIVRVRRLHQQAQW